MADFETVYQNYRVAYYGYFLPPAGYRKIGRRSRCNITHLKEMEALALAGYATELEMGNREYLEDLKVAFEAGDYAKLWLLVNVLFYQRIRGEVEISENPLFIASVAFYYEMVEKTLHERFRVGKSRLMSHNYFLFTEMMEVIFMDENRGQRYVELVEQLLKSSHPNWFDIQRLAIWNLPYVSMPLTHLSNVHTNEWVREELVERIWEVGGGLLPSVWKQLQRCYPIGTRICGLVHTKEPYGIWLQIETPKALEWPCALLEIMRVSDTPLIGNEIHAGLSRGDTVCAIVLWLDQQSGIRVSTRKSDFGAYGFDEGW